MTFSTNFTNFLEKRKLAITIVWILVFITFTALYAGNFFNVTSNEFAAPEGTDAFEARLLLEQFFPEKVNEFTHIIILQDNNNPVLTSKVADFTVSLIQDLNQSFSNELGRIAGYFVFFNTPLDSIKDNFLSQDGSTTFIAIDIDGDTELQLKVAEHIREFIHDFDLDPLEVHSVGQAELELDTDESIERDLSRIDSITIPLVFIALAFLLRNWRYFPITIAPIVMTILLSFAALERYVVLTDNTIQSFVPSTLISLSLGIGVDYNLFLLSRFREERLKGKSVVKSVEKMLKHAGHTVFTSGLTLTIALSGLAFFPITILASVGVGIAVAILILLTINLTFTPALLLLFGNWIENTDKKEKEKETDDTKDEKSEKSENKEKTPEFGIWYKIGKFSTKYNYAILLIILLVTLPLAFQILDSHPKTQTAFFAPRGSDSSLGFAILEEKFGPGQLGPLFLVIQPEDMDVWSNETFTAINIFIETAINQTTLEPINFASHAYLNGTAITYSQAGLLNSLAQLPLNQSALIPDEAILEARLYTLYSQQYVSQDNNANKAAFIEIILPMDPFSPQAADLLNELKNIADDAFNEGFQIGFTGTTPESSAMIEETYKLFPMMILIVVILIYIFIAIMFKAIFLPARLIATIALTLSFIFGAATVIFEKDTFINDIFPAVNGVSVTFWMVPIMSFSIILGLGIDYDIFTIERIRENIWNGMENKEGIAQGIDKTGRIITGAGIIMMIAFGGLMFSSSYILMQFGFVLSFSVLLDTFLVRSILVPAIMSFQEKLNWWPSKPKIDNKP